ncbi:MAG TPA: carbon storage regulator [Terriglobia bacterium]|nr:carbon storage regulator [Terriglobia bacterium]
MLIISRKKDEKIMIGDNIEVVILETGRNRVRFGINAPRHVSVQTRLAQPASAAEASDQVEEKEEKAGLQPTPAHALKV